MKNPYLMKPVTVQFQYRFTRLSTGSKPESCMIEKEFRFKDVADLATQAAAEGAKVVKMLHGETPNEQATVALLIFKL
jgi:hypothetical protein